MREKAIGAFNAAYKEVISPGRLTPGLMTTFELAPVPATGKMARMRACIVSENEGNSTGSWII
ncbi:hypothetical protein D3878_06715 [Noviherbaspirillum sedimenti]|uniref:Uncharacterized protein n=1 Tax=Noviherbaspirillum sedimenti TaxID=2320865 RepID=A0A3A3G070_9BURK|nr:hypothetical protein D3878_06715 [Noviherbaspirillum sedimenti]